MWLSLLLFFSLCLLSAGNTSEAFCSVRHRRNQGKAWIIGMQRTGRKFPCEIKMSCRKFPAGGRAGLQTAEGLDMWGQGGSREGAEKLGSQAWSPCRVAGRHVLSLVYKHALFCFCFWPPMSAGSTGGWWEPLGSHVALLWLTLCWVPHSAFHSCTGRPVADLGLLIAADHYLWASVNASWGPLSGPGL